MFIIFRHSSFSKGLNYKPFYGRIFFSEVVKKCVLVTHCHSLPLDMSGSDYSVELVSVVR
jgi:hypothetical protein